MTKAVMACDRCNRDREEDNWETEDLSYMKVLHQSKPVASPSKVAIISQSVKLWHFVITETPHSLASLFLSWYPSPLIFFFLWVNHRMADGFLKQDVERVQDRTQAQDDPFISSEQAVTGPKFSTKWFPWRVVVLAQSQTLPAVTHRCMEVTRPFCWLSRRLGRGKMMHILSLWAPRCLWRGLNYIVL